MASRMRTGPDDPTAAVVRDAGPLRIALHSRLTPSSFLRARFSQNLERKQPLIILSRAAPDQRSTRRAPSRGDQVDAVTWSPGVRGARLQPQAKRQPDARRRGRRASPTTRCRAARAQTAIDVGAADGAHIVSDSARCTIGGLEPFPAKAKWLAGTHHSYQVVTVHEKRPCPTVTAKSHCGCLVIFHDAASLNRATSWKVERKFPKS